MKKGTYDGLTREERRECIAWRKWVKRNSNSNGKAVRK